MSRIRGEYINKREWTEIILKESRATYEDLASWGVEFPVATSEIKDYRKSSQMRYHLDPPNKGWGDFHAAQKNYAGSTEVGQEGWR